MFYSKSTGGFYSKEIHGDNIPYDAVEITKDEHSVLLQGQSEGKIIAADNDGNPVLQDQPAMNQEQVIKQYESTLDAHLDSVARQHRYDSRFTFALRAGYVGPYQAEAIAFAQWMDDSNVQAFARMSRVLQGAEAMPTIESLIADLPIFVKP